MTPQQPPEIILRLIDIIAAIAEALVEAHAGTIRKFLIIRPAQRWCEHMREALLSFAETLQAEPPSPAPLSAAPAPRHAPAPGPAGSRIKHCPRRAPAPAPPPARPVAHIIRPSAATVTIHRPATNPRGRPTTHPPPAAQNIAQIAPPPHAHFVTRS